MAVTVHVYFQDTVQGLLVKASESGATGIVQNTDGSSIVLHGGDNGWHMECYDNFVGVPEVLCPHVRFVTLWDYPPMCPHRERGVYRHGSAEAVLDLGKIGGNPYAKIQVSATNMDDAQMLWRMIRAGSIRPAESFEKEQVALA